ncbi:MAG TPA: pyruvate:ferredoxin (flavodoxin) oxidoreductase [Tepidisphaeraceae bacterium]|nr:pyruvate:ferredoxin (flavodoxin) oxidoreductase [Tepidisphaeraceae bacterium]
MASRQTIALEGNEAVASVAHRLSEVIAIYPITPSSAMGEFADEWSSVGKTNIWGMVPRVVEMQSEGGAAGAIHGALQAGALATTFTASQGLLLMVPNLYKIAGELTSFCMHVSARSLATHALSIFGDHSDVMACRQTGFAMLCSNGVQEAQDLACIAHAATLESRVPFMHFFDGFRTSHEIQKISLLSDDDLRSMMDGGAIAGHKNRSLTPDHPVVRGTAQNPDTFFQSRERANPFYIACPETVEKVMERFAKLTGRQYRLFDYVGHPKAERVIVIMGSGADTAHETVDRLTSEGEKVGVLKVRLYRPFAVEKFLAALPESVKSIAVMDRTKEPGSVGEPLFLDVVAALHESDRRPAVIGGRYGLGSHEFTPAMVKSVFDELKKTSPKRRFTAGINDDVTKLSLATAENFEIEPADVFRAVFFGLGADGTVGANKNSIKIIGEETDFFTQGYFVYDSKKSGAMTISHLRFGPRPIRSAYLIHQANFVACHSFHFLERLDIIGCAMEGGVLLLNAPFPTADVWKNLPGVVQREIIARKLKVYAIDACEAAREAGMGRRINTVMQTCFFAISGVLPRDEAIARIKKAIEKTYAKKGAEIVAKNFAAVDGTLSHLHEITVRAEAHNGRAMLPVVPDEAPDFVRNVTAMMLANKGDLLPVSAMPVDGTWPVGTSRWEKRNIATEIPVWEPELCIQCNKCAFSCPHAAIRAKAYPEEHLARAPVGFVSTDYNAPDLRGLKYTLQVAPEDCTGCGLCIAVCPAKDKSTPRRKAINLAPQPPLREQEARNFKFFLEIPEIDRSRVRLDVKGSQFFQPLMEFSGACAGCGETPYIKLLTQLMGDRILIANATGCSSIYGGNLPTTPYCADRHGRGPAWSNSLFEDNAEFGLGMRLAVDQQAAEARQLLRIVAPALDGNLVKEILGADQSTEQGIAAQRKRVEELHRQLEELNGDPNVQRLAGMADYLVYKGVWIIGGDGWAYDIGYGGLDHVLASGQDVKVLVLDTEVYSNTGGQQSKSTPIAAAAKFAAAGKSSPKKDLGLLAMTYGNVYVAQVAFGAKDVHTVKAFQEAASYPGPALIIAYSHCIAHGYDLALGPEQQKLAVASGYWPLYRYDPRRRETGDAPLQLDSPVPNNQLPQFMMNETRFRMVEQKNPDRYKTLLEAAKQQVVDRHSLYQRLAQSPEGSRPAAPLQPSNTKVSV